MKLTKVSKVLATAAIQLSISISTSSIFLPSAFAGECKVSRPSDDVLADALGMVDLNEAKLGEITLAYEKATKRKLQIVIVARAGQDLSNQVILKDFSQQRIPLTLEDIYKSAYNDNDSRPVNQMGPDHPDFTLLKNVIEKKFGEPGRSLAFSHVGFMIRFHPGAPPLKAGEIPMWRAFHMLRPCKNDNPKDDFERLQQQNLNRPFLWDEGSFNFFADNPHELKIRYFVPTPEIQERLMEIVFNDELMYALNSRYYNAGANWQNVNESNSNQWVLEVLAAAARPKSQVRTRAEAQQVLAKMNYIPTKVLFKGKQAYANLPGAQKIAPYLTYHAKEQPFYFKASMGEIISALSVEEFLGRSGLLFGSYETKVLEKTETKRLRAEPPKPKVSGRSNR